VQLLIKLHKQVSYTLWFQGDRSLDPTPVRPREQYVFLALFLLIIIFTLIDVLRDIGEGLSLTHISHELGIVLLCGVLIFYQIKLLKKKQQSLVQMKDTVQALSNENLKIKEDLKKFSGQLHEIIDQQMNSWHLSVSEKDIARFILKGLNMKEIAQIRNTSEATVRQQAMNIYRKANVHSRQEFIAYFLEDL
jgi:DNA-binding CsgD family transcriptional regulator